jgi:hypothetical protein
MNSWQNIEQIIREELIAKTETATDDDIATIVEQFVHHLMAGKDFRVTIEEIVDDFLYSGEPEWEDDDLMAA